MLGFSALAPAVLQTETSAVKGGPSHVCQAGQAREPGDPQSALETRTQATELANGAPLPR